MIRLKSQNEATENRLKTTTNQLVFKPSLAMKWTFAYRLECKYLMTSGWTAWFFP